MSILRMGRVVRIGDRVLKVKGVLGEGGSGEVYLVADAEMQFALKLFFPFYQLRLNRTTGVAHRVSEVIAFQRREYEFLSKLTHPNILKVRHVGDVKLHEPEKKKLEVPGIERLPFLVAEYVDGLPLSEAISEYELPAEDVMRILRRLALALQYLHAERQYLHTDIKSANILVRRIDCEPILIDFALCKNLNFAEVNADENTVLDGDWDLFPKGLSTDHGLKLLKETTGPRRALREHGQSNRSAVA